MRHRDDVGKRGHVVEDARLGSQQGRGEERQGRVLGPTDGDFATKRTTAANTKRPPLFEWAGRCCGHCGW